MSDAGWAALASIMASICSMIGVVFAKQARDQSQKNEGKIEQHEEASAARSAEVKAALPCSGSD